MTDFFQSTGFEIIGAIVGLVYLYLEYKADKWLWPVGILMPLIYIIIFYEGKFYADMAINIYYFFASIYGWIRWTKIENMPTENRISHMPTAYVVPLGIVCALLFALIAFILIRFTDSPVPYGDSFTTAVSIIGMWMLAHKYLEQWWLWFVVNVVSSALYLWKGLYPTSVLFMIYSVISVFGYFRWKKMMMDSEYKIPQMQHIDK